MLHLGLIKSLFSPRHKLMPQSVAQHTNVQSQV